MIAVPTPTTWLTLVTSILLVPLVSAAEIQPNRLDFGTVYVGGRVEGSVRIFVEPADAAAKKADVVAPPFVRVKRSLVGTQKYGQRTRGYCDLIVAIDTSRSAKNEGSIRVIVGGAKAEVPVQATVLPRKPGATRVLVAETPFHRNSTSDADLFKPWLKLVESTDIDCDYIELSGKWLTEADLTKFDVVLLGGLGVHALTDQDVTILKAFAEKGGRVILTANHFFVGTVPKANAVLASYGLRIRDEEPRVRNEFEVGPDSIAPCPFTEGVKSLHFHRPSPTEVLDPDKTFVLVDGPADFGGVLLAYARAGEGEVLGLSESLWWSWIAKADNAVLFGNLLKKRPRAR